MAAIKQGQATGGARQVQRRFPLVLLRWPVREMSGEAKCCAIELWERVGGEARPLEICYSELGPYLGGSESAARRWLAALERAGLVKRIKGELGPDGGAYYEIRDPDQAWRERRLTKLTHDGQETLFDEESIDDAPMVANLVASDGGTDVGFASDVETDESPDHASSPVVAFPVASDGKPRSSVAPIAPEARAVLVLLEQEQEIPPPPTSSCISPALPTGEQARADDLLRAGGVADASVPTTWPELERWLYAAGVDQPREAIAAARAAGCDASLAWRCAEHWQAARPAWRPGALYDRLRRLRPGDDPQRGWPKLPDVVRQRLERRAKPRPAEQPPVAVDRRHERYAAALASLSDEAFAELWQEAFAGVPFTVELLARQGRSHLVNEQLVDWLVKHNRDPPVAASPA